MQNGRGSPLGRALRLGAMVCALGLSFIASIVLGLVLHLDMGVTRRSVQNLANVLLADALVGEIRVGDIERLSSGELRIVDFRAATAEGDEVLYVEDVRLQGEWLLPALAVLMRGEGTVLLPYIRVERARLGLDFQPDGKLSLAHAFSPRPEEKKPEEPPTPPEPPKIGIELSTVELGQVDIDGAFGDGLPVDGTVSRLVGYFEAGARGVFADIGRSSLRERRLLGAETSGTVDYHIRAERDGKFATWGNFSGHLGELEIHAQALYHDGSVHAEIELPRVGSRELRPWLPGRPLERPVSARARITGLAPLLRVEGEVSLPPVRDQAPGKLSMHGTLRVAQPPLIEADLEAERLDVRLFGADLPTTELNARARMRATLAGENSELFGYVHG
ncbi:MAG TPA: hypothetical protein VFB62_04150, partial [Polyangiaceae bacterium]|nr:hypothetical protein [Polyangiaceae bacterium]